MKLLDKRCDGCSLGCGIREFTEIFQLDLEAIAQGVITRQKDALP
jgi:hypothetical protein